MTSLPLCLPHNRRLALTARVAKSASAEGNSNGFLPCAIGLKNQRQHKAVISQIQSCRASGHFRPRNQTRPCSSMRGTRRRKAVCKSSIDGAGGAGTVTGRSPRLGTAHVEAVRSMPNRPNTLPGTGDALLGERVTKWCRRVVANLDQKDSLHRQV